MTSPIQSTPLFLSHLLCFFALTASTLLAGMAYPQDKPPTPATTSVARHPILFIIGDSTVKNGSGAGGGGLWGWGEPIVDLFDTNRLTVQNKARGGRSSRTYLTEGLWAQVLADLKPGDFVLMQFGHNDGGPLDTGRARASLHGIGDETKVVTMEATGKPETVHTYGWYLHQYIADTQAKGATPIVLSPIPRNGWMDGKINRSTDYGPWAAQVAKADGVAFVDLNGIIADRYDPIGAEKVGADFFTPTDHTHTSLAGAKFNAVAVVEGLRGLKECALCGYLKDAKK